MKTQTTYKGVESSPELEGRITTIQGRLEAAVPGGRFAKYVVEQRGTAHAVGVVVTLPDGDTWVRHADAADWEHAFLELERRVDRLAQGD